MLKDCSIGKVENHYPKVRMKEKPVYTGEQSQENTDSVRGTGGLSLFFFCVLPGTSVSGSSQGILV